MELEKFKTRLEEEKGQLTTELSAIAIPNKEIAGDWEAVRGDDPSVNTSSDEVAEELEDLTERKAAEELLEKQLAKVNLALKKIEENKFGQCEVGNEPIEEDRLEANPTARTCKAHLEEEGGLAL